MTEVLSTPEFQPVLSWYKEACRKLPEMQVTVTPMKDAKESLVNPLFFSYANVDVSMAQNSWQQGGIIQTKESGMQGATILLTDPDGRTFVTVSQEPLADAKYRTPIGTLRETSATGAVEIHPVVRSPLQTSAQKLKRMDDPAMKLILTHVAKSRNQSVAELIRSVPLSPSPTDGNRMQSNILYGNVEVPASTAAEIARLVPGGRWVSAKELDYLTVMGTTNGNLNIARSVVEAQKRLAVS
jgi:hypothetical protein